MALNVGDRVGNYDVTALIGAGGMGQVYRAHDTKLDRDVALKVLPEAFTADPDRLARFEREAKVLASLNHPNIGHIYGLEEAEETKALVLELVEGPTLADRIAQGPIPLDEALPIATQIAEALEAAHEQGIVHRDLKPANVKVRDDGTVKVLDFGLAKAIAGEGAASDLSDSPTVTAMATATGVILGTAAYMSPEQAKGKPVDRRTDVWAFGALLYEMLTGRRAFQGRDVSETLVAILTAKVDLDLLPAKTPLRLRQVLFTCLRKEPKERVQAVGDVRLAMEGAFETPAAALGELTVASQLRIWQQPHGVAIGALLVAVMTALAVWGLIQPAPSSPPPITRFAITLPPSESGLGAREVALSPDGTLLAYVANQQIYLRSMDQVEATPVRGTYAAGGAFGPYGRRPFFWLSSSSCGSF